MTRALDVQWMKRALANAEKGWGQTAPNPMVGAVVVSDGIVVADGWHARFGEGHAEAMALREAGDRAHGSTLYVTLEPCTHHGKTPPCADAVIGAGVRRVVIAIRDPNPKAGGGVERLQEAGIDVTVGIEGAAARELNAPFFNAFSSDRPWVVLKMAISMDGGVADPSGKRRWITGPDSRREVHRMRANADAVAVGIGTVIADNPDLRVRDFDAPRRQPIRVVFDSTLRIPVESTMVRTARETPTFVVASRADPARRSALEALGVSVIVPSSLPQAVAELRRRGVQSLLVEGGPKLAGSFLAAGLVDRLALFTAPFALGDDAPKAFAFAPPGFSKSLEDLPIVVEERFDEDSLIIRAVSPRTP